MSYRCIECGSEFEYKQILKNKLKCTKCKETRSNIWVKQRSKNLSKTVLAR